MKPLFPVIVMSFAMLLIACSKDSTPAAAPSIVGSWQYNGEIYSGCDDPADNTGKTCIPPDCNYVYTFNSNGTFSLAGSSTGQPSINFTGTYIITGNSYSYSYNTGSSIGTITETGTFTVTATQLTTVGATSGGCTITATFTRK